MPSAGAIIPPTITPLRESIVGRPGTHIDTVTYVELDTESADCKIYFTTDGTRPSPFQPRVGGREVTFRYRGPFTLKPGKRVLKAVAVSRDGIQESNVVTKNFVVDDASREDELDSLFSEDSYVPPRKTTTRRSISNLPSRKTDHVNL